MVKINWKLFFGVLIISYFFLLVIPLDPFRIAMAGTSSYFLNSMGFDATSHGSIVETEFGQFNVSNDCLGVVSIATILALLLATSLKNKTRVLFMLLSLIIFPLWNLARIVISIYLGRNNFELFHFSLWVVSTFIILGVYLASIRFDRSRTV